MGMRLPQLIASNRKVKKDTIVFKGLDRRSLINDDNLSASKNISMTRCSPLVSCRAPRTTLYTLVSPQALFSVGSAIVCVDGTDFKYNNAIKGTVTVGSKSMVDFNGKIIIMPDKKYYDYGTDIFGTITDTGPDATVPDMDYICVHMNRIFGVKGNNIYASALGQYNNWSTFAKLSTDSWAKSVASEGGSFIGIASYQNHPILFKSGVTYELYNNKPDYVTQPVNKIGCVSNRAIAEVDSVLYFVGEKGVYSYNGGAPRLISDNINEVYSDATMGTDGKLLYVSLHNGITWNLYVYDTSTGYWIKEDDLQVVQFTRIGEYTHALASDGKLYKLNSGTESISWEMESKDFTQEIFNRKGTGMIHIRADLSLDTVFNVYISIDGNSYALVKTITATSAGMTKFHKMLKIKMSDRFKVKLSGTGDFKLHGFGREVQIGEGY